MNHQIDNYPGFPEGIDGVSLTQRMEAQAKQSGLEILRAQVRGLELRENPKLLCTDAGDIRAKPLRQILTAASDGGGCRPNGRRIFIKNEVIMQYLISFLEGIVTFLSPCLLPMLPIYVSYFAGGGERSTGRTLGCGLGFVAGFTAVFMAMGALAGTIGGLLTAYRRPLELLSGIVVIVFGLNYLGLFRWNLFQGGSRMLDTPRLSVFSAFLFGVVFSLGWTPCVGAFLGSALLLASQRGHVLEGMGMLLAYSLGLGIPFLVSAVLIDGLKTAFDWVKRHYRIINCLSGCFLILVGVMMATGTLGRLLGLLQSGGIG